MQSDFALETQKGKHMAKGDDYLEQLWNEVIDVKANHQWTTQCRNQMEELSKGPFKAARSALLRLLEQKAAVRDLERLAAFVRYQTCFGVLVALDDPGLGKSKIAGIYKDFRQSSPKAKPRTKREKFIQYLWETEGFLDDDGKWLKSLTKNDFGTKPFQRMLPIVERLLERAKRVRDLGLFLGWNSYESCARTLRLMEEAGFERGDELVYLHEGLESACPDNSVRRPKLKADSTPDPTEPVWRIKSAQALAISPDSKTLAVAGASSPIRLYDLATGQERLACEGIRAHIYEIAFSPNGQHVTAGKIDKELSVCDVNTGKLLHRLKRSEDEISGLEQTPKGELICSSWCSNVVVFNSITGKSLPSLCVNENDEMVDAITLYNKGTRLAVLCAGTVTVWSWPERNVLLNIQISDAHERCNELSSSPDGGTLAVCERDEGVHLFRTTNGKRFGRIPVRDLYQGIAFTPDGSHLVVTHHHDDKLSIWQLSSLKKVCELTPKSPIYQVEVSRDGRSLAAATEQGAFVWKLQPLLGQRGS